MPQRRTPSRPRGPYAPRHAPAAGLGLAGSARGLARTARTGRNQTSGRLVALAVVAVGSLALSGAAAARTQPNGPARTVAAPTARAPLGPAPSSSGPATIEALVPIERATRRVDPGGPSARAPAAPGPSSAGATSPVLMALVSDGIPSVAFTAFTAAAAREARLDPACGIAWPLLAAIGRVESDDGRFDGAVLHADGTSTPKIIGIALNGVGTAAVPDTDHGRLDGDPVWDHAVGPMQFIPSTWARFGVDVTGSGDADPFNINDAAAAAADYLCRAGGDLRTAAGQQQAILAYNHSSAYLSTVSGLAAEYATDAGLPIIHAPAATATAPASTPLPPVDPGRPPALPDPAPGHPSPSAGSSVPSAGSGASGSPDPSNPSCPAGPSSTAPTSPATDPAPTDSASTSSAASSSAASGPSSSGAAASGPDSSDPNGPDAGTDAPTGSDSPTDGGSSADCPSA